MGKNNRTIFERLKIEERKLNIFVPLDIQSVKLLSDFGIYGLLYDIKSDKDFATTVNRGNIYCPSPFFIYTINNRILCYKIQHELTEEFIKELEIEDIYKNRLNPDDVGIWAIKDSKVKIDDFIRDNYGLLRTNSYDNYMHNIMCDFSNMLVFYNHG